MNHLVSIAQHVGYPGIFLIVFLESGIPFTFFLPGDSLLFTVGFLASQGYFSLPILIPLIFIGALCGSYAGYYIGKKFGDMFLDGKEYWWFSQKHFISAKKFFDRYGTHTIVLGRFVPIVRTFAPSLAGALDMKFNTFSVYSCIGGVLWAGGITSLGFYLGQLIPHVETYLTPILILIVFVSIIPAVWEWYGSKKKKTSVQ
jgi:membrane-associated protein